MESSPDTEALFCSYNSFLDGPPLTQTTTVAPNSGSVVDQPCDSDFLRFMAVAQVLGADFLFFDWKENVLSGLGSGATGKIHQSPLFLNKGFAFKTFHISKSLELEAATYRTLVAEMLTLCHADIEKHPNIVKLYGVTFDVVSFQQGPEFHRRVWPVLVLEKSSHGDLRQFFQHQEMSFEQAILVTMQIGSAIKEMHLADMIHGDIKPHNVLVDVDPSDGTLTPKLTDFGFSCYGCSEETIVYPPQTPGWCAPEWHPRGFTIKKVKKLDIFSYGLLCAWIFLQGKVDTADIIAMSKNELVDRIAGVHRNEIAKDPVLQQICNRLDWFFAQSLVLNVEERGGHMRDLLIGFINPLLEYHGQLEDETYARFKVRKTLPQVPVIADDFEELQSVHFLVRKQPVQDLGVLADKSLGLQSYYAAFELALCHHLAFGTAKDDDKSRFWLTKSGKAYEDFHHAISVAQERRDYHGPLRDGRMSEYLEYDPGVAYSEMGLLDDAISALREEADGKEGIGQVVHSQLALQSHMSHLLSLRDRAGDREDDLQLRKLIAERTEEVQGPEDPNTLLALTRYAKLLTDFDEAEVIHRRVLAARRKIHAANHPDILKAMDTLARTLLFKGGDTPVAEALALLKEAHTETVAKFGATHPQCITLGRHLGRALMANHQLVDAETILGDSMQYAELHFGKLHYEYEATEREFVSVLYRRGRKQEALGIAQSAIRIQEAAYGVDGDRSMRIVRLYVSIFWVRDAELVIGIQRQLVDNMRRKRGKDMATAAEVRRLGLMCHQLGLTKDCIKAYEEYVGYYKTLLGMKDSKTVKSATFLARAYRQDGQLRRAVDVFFQFEDVSAMEAGVQLDVLNDWKRYMEYCCECSLWNSAIQLQKRVVELVTSSKGSTDMDIIYEQQRLADLLEHSE